MVFVCALTTNLVHGNMGRHKQHHQSLLEVEKERRRGGEKGEETFRWWEIVWGRQRSAGKTMLFLPIILSQLQANVTTITGVSNL